MRVIPKDKVIFHFNPTNPANYTVEDGETFWVECDDCYSGQITDESVKRPDIDIGIMDCAVGPIAISGAHPGDTLAWKLWRSTCAAGRDGHIGRTRRAG